MVGCGAGSYRRGEDHQGGQMRELTQPTSALRLLLAGPDVGNGLRPTAVANERSLGGSGDPDHRAATRWFVWTGPPWKENP
jgi:hypothetical protein